MCCALSLVCCLLFLVRCLLFLVSCLLFLMCCLLFLVCPFYGFQCGFGVLCFLLVRFCTDVLWLLCLLSSFCLLLQRSLEEDLIVGK